MFDEYLLRVHKNKLQQMYVISLMSQVICTQVDIHCSSHNRLNEIDK